MGIYVISKESWDPGHYDDIGIFVENWNENEKFSWLIILDNTGSEAQACVVMLRVIYALNLAYPKELRHYYKFIQKVLMQMDGEKLSPRILGLKNKIGVGLYEFFSHTCNDDVVLCLFWIVKGC